LIFLFAVFHQTTTTEKMESKNLVAITGLIGAGKGTVERILCEQFGYTKMAFGAALKDACAIIHPRWDRKMLEGDTPESRHWREQTDPHYACKFGIPGYTPRLALKRLGTECVRHNLADNAWVEACMHVVDANPDKRFVISDARFMNEVNAVRARGGTVVHVTRGPKHVAEAMVKMKNGTLHKSEHMTLSNEYVPDVVLNNTGSIADLERTVTGWFEDSRDGDDNKEGDE
jgi:hypothetical protein